MNEKIHIATNITQAIQPLGPHPFLALILGYGLPVVSYLIGSIPFGLLLTKAAGYGDIRKIGSGNIGATNVLRTGNKKLAALTLLLDGGKGAAAVLLLRYAGNDDFNLGLIAAVFAFLGHLFPIWLKFKGGKGVATTLGILLALQPALGATCCAIWLAMAMLFRYSSLSALVSIGLSPYIALKFAYAETVIHGGNGGGTVVMDHIFLPVLCSFMAVLVFYKHRENIRRLIAGTEPKIAKKKEATATTQ